jgi:hypothetical protein
MNLPPDPLSFQERGNSKAENELSPLFLREGDQGMSSGKDNGFILVVFKSLLSSTRFLCNREKFGFDAEMMFIPGEMLP